MAEDELDQVWSQLYIVTNAYRPHTTALGIVGVTLSWMFAISHPTNLGVHIRAGSWPTFGTAPNIYRASGVLWCSVYYSGAVVFPVSDITETYSLYVGTSAARGNSRSGYVTLDRLGGNSGSDVRENPFSLSQGTVNVVTFVKGFELAQAQKTFARAFGITPELFTAPVSPNILVPSLKIGDPARNWLRVS